MAAIIVAASVGVGGGGSGAVGASIVRLSLKNFIGFTEIGAVDAAEVQAYFKDASVQTQGALTADGHR